MLNTSCTYLNYQLSDTDISNHPKTDINSEKVDYQHLEDAKTRPSKHKAWLHAKER